jgi:hypothetical protein
MPLSIGNKAEIISRIRDRVDLLDDL